jgi:outer membrane protein OmpA-like peptidoglycan-associated protein
MADWDWKLPPPNAPTRVVLTAAENEEKGHGAGLGLGIAAVLTLLIGTASITLAVLRDRGDDDSLGNVAAPVTTAITSAASNTVTTAAGVTVTTTATAPTTSQPVPNTTAASTTTVVTPSTAAAPNTTVTPATTAAPVYDDSIGLSSTPPRWAVYDGGKVYLRGVVPNDAVAAEIVRKAGAVLGPENIIDEYSRVPGAPVPRSAPLYIADLVLFQPNSAVIQGPFKSLLDNGALLMRSVPSVVITIRGHTDDVGSEASNLALSQARVDAAKEYLVSVWAIDPGRIRTVALGESEPTGDNTTLVGRALNRRLEFVITGLLGS